jgi:hypothetical protein
LEQVNLGYSLKGIINVPTTVANPPAVDPTQTSDSGITTTDGAVNQTSEQPAQTPPVTQNTYVTEDWTAPIGFFNVPHGAAKALHLFNRQYAASTNTSANSVEVILDAGSAEKYGTNCRRNHNSYC